MDPWQRISERFRTTYEWVARSVAAAWRPVLEVHSDRVLLLRTAEGDHEFRWDPGPAEDDLRVLSHVPLLMYLVTRSDQGHQEATDDISELVTSMLENLSVRDLSAEQRERNRRLLTRAAALLAEVDTLSPERTPDVITLAQELRPVIDANLADAARLNLDALGSAVAGALAILSDDQIDRLVILNRGNKSARIGNQVDLFMRAVLGDGAADQRLVFAEGIDDTDAARRVLGEYLLDRTIGYDFFGDALTMRTDVLSSPTSEELQRRIDAGSIPQRHPRRSAPDGLAGGDD